MPTELKDFKERSNPTVYIELNGQRFVLMRYTLSKEIQIKHEFGGKLKDWQNCLNELDPEALVKTLWILLEDKQTFPNWESLAEKIQGDLTEKINILEAITVCITANMPDVQEAVKKRSAIAKSQALTLLRSSLIGPGSTTALPKSTAGTAKKSKTLRTTK